MIMALKMANDVAVASLLVDEKKEETPSNCPKIRLLTSAVPIIIDRNSFTQ